MPNPFLRTLTTWAPIALIATTVPAHARPEAPHPGGAIRRAMAAQGPIVTDADNAMIRAKCGLPASARPNNNVQFTNGALQCPDGRRVRDADTVAMSDRIGARASAHVDAAMADPAVKAAIDTYTSAKTRAALRKAGIMAD